MTKLPRGTTRCIGATFFSLVLALLPCRASAAEGQPLALRNQADGSFVIETFNGQSWIMRAEETPAEDSPVKSIVLTEEEPGSAKKQSRAVFAAVDGVDVLMAPEPWLADDQTTSLKADLRCDVLILSSPNLETLMGKSATALVQQTRPDTVVFNRLDPGTENLDVLTSKLDASAELRVLDQNTLALCGGHDSSTSPRRFVVMSDAPWTMPEDLSRLFTAMEKSCEASQAVFAELSTEQMSFRPANGTHTPRWNAEHMRGRQLQFFSQIFNAVDPTIPVMNVNPKQMPADYVPANPVYSGSDEAAAMKNVSRFCRRFAYLLDGIDLKTKPPASRWPSLEALLKQMDRHYQEHTSNVIKKSELPDWPQS